MEQNYILERLEKLDDKFDGKLDKILEQTTKTNGRVNQLEKIVAAQETIVATHSSTINYFKGVVKAAVVVAGAIGALAGMFISHFITKL